MQVQVIDGALVVDLNGGVQPTLAAKDFADAPLTLKVEPAFYIALGATGLMERNVSVTVVDRKNVAALVGNWIAEGYHPLPVDAKTFGRHVRNLLAATKPAKPAVDVTATEPAAPEATPAVTIAEVSDI